MNLWFRLLWLWIAGRSRSTVPVLGPCRTPFHVSLFDLDVFRHMNNGRYFTIMDLARVDMMQRSGMLAKLDAQRFFPVVTAASMYFRKSLNWRQTFEIETQVVAWDDKSMYLTQRFLLGPEEVALGLVRARFLRRSGGSVPTSEILALAGEPLQTPVMDAWLTQWIQQLNTSAPAAP